MFFFFFFWQFLPAAIAIVFPLFGFMLRVFTSYTFSYQYNFCLLPKKKKKVGWKYNYIFKKKKKKKKRGLKITINKTNIHKLTLQRVSKIAHNLIDWSRKESDTHCCRSTVSNIQADFHSDMQKTYLLKLFISTGPNPLPHLSLHIPKDIKVNSLQTSL